jgi:hypothetical protein
MTGWSENPPLWRSNGKPASNRAYFTFWVCIAFLLFVPAAFAHEATFFFLMFAFLGGLLLAYRRKGILKVDDLSIPVFGMAWGYCFPYLVYFFIIFGTAIGTDVVARTSPAIT